VSVPRHIPTLLHGPGCNLGNGSRIMWKSFEKCAQLNGDNEILLPEKKTDRIDHFVYDVT